MTAPPRTGDEPHQVIRGVAKVGKPPGVRASAPVPGALSMPTGAQRRLPRLSSPSTVFPRRAADTAPPTDPPTPPIDPPASPADVPASPADPADQLADPPAPPAASPPVAVRSPVFPAGSTALPPAPSTLRARFAGQPVIPVAAPPAVEPGDQSPGAEPGAAPAATSGGAAAPGDGAPVVPERKHFALPAVAAVLAAFVAGTGYLAFADRPAGPDVGRWAASPAPVTAAPALAAPTQVTRPPGDPFGTVTAVPAGVPTRLRVGAIGVDSTLERLRIGRDGELAAPRAFDKAGWYADGTAPGDTGPAVIAGHVDSRSGPAVFYRLRELTVGDRIEVTRGGVVLRFRVTRTAWYPKAAFPTDEVYGPTPDRQLRLITCGGVFDRSLRSYRDNLVVYAVAG